MFTNSLLFTDYIYTAR